MFYLKKIFIAFVTVLFAVGCGDLGQSSRESYTEIQTESETEIETETEQETETETQPETETETETVPEPEPEPDTATADGYVEYHFRSRKLLEQHFAKHGDEFSGDFDYQTAEDYEQGASDVINDTDALFKTESEDGDGVYYIESTNEFVILSTDGFIRTYFRPNDGIDYFNRQ